MELIRLDILNAVRMPRVVIRSKPVKLDYWPAPCVLIDPVRQPGRSGFSVKLGPVVLFKNSDCNTGDFTAGLTRGRRVYFLTSYEPTCGEPLRMVGKLYLWRIGK